MIITIIFDVPFCLFRKDAITDVPGVVDQVKGLYNMYKILICQLSEVSLNRQPFLVVFWFSEPSEW